MIIYTQIETNTYNGMIIVCTEKWVWVIHVLPFYHIHSLLFEYIQLLSSDIDNVILSVLYASSVLRNEKWVYLHSLSYCIMYKNEFIHSVYLRQHQRIMIICTQIIESITLQCPNMFERPNVSVNHSSHQKKKNRRRSAYLWTRSAETFLWRRQILVSRCYSFLLLYISGVCDYACLRAGAEISYIPSLHLFYDHFLFTSDWSAPVSYTHRPSIKGTKLLFIVIKAIIIIT